MDILYPVVIELTFVETLCFIDIFLSSVKECKSAV